MPSEPADKNGKPHPSPTKPVIAAQVVVDDSMLEANRRFEQSAEEREARSLEWERTVSELATIRDETDTEEIWSEVLRNLRARSVGSD